MKLSKFSILFLLMLLVFAGCEKDENDPETVPPRDRAEQEVDDQEALQAYLETHFFNYEDFENPAEAFNYNIVIDTIAGANSDKTPLIESDLLEKKTITREGVEYTYYVLKVREGAGEQPKFTDSTFVAYRGELLNQNQFDASPFPVWFDLTQTIPGFSRALLGFGGASGFDVQPDNSVEWTNDYGIGAVFLPSGLGYFSSNQNPTIPPYSPLVFTFNLYAVNDADHDRDGILSWKEDLNEDMIIGNDNTDGDSFPNYIDADDDGDFIPTLEEITDEDGQIILPYPDKDNDGTPDYLDPDN